MVVKLNYILKYFLLKQIELKVNQNKHFMKLHLMSFTLGLVPALSQNSRCSGIFQNMNLLVIFQVRQI